MGPNEFPIAVCWLMELDKNTWTSLTEMRLSMKLLTLIDQQTFWVWKWLKFCRVWMSQRRCFLCQTICSFLTHHNDEHQHRAGLASKRFETRRGRRAYSQHAQNEWVKASVHQQSNEEWRVRFNASTSFNTRTNTRSNRSSGSNNKHDDALGTYWRRWLSYMAFEEADYSRRV